ncbi:NADH dehydrogenase subunit 2 (mitochondrion) [Fragariocoptes setiger]|uniref:NADH-ubiquinone oxidoreductase chain 2 n=1 Tax=Fragariocoptes setiger TaxID=1670756 RepID=A0ABQ7SDE2_9ACAR|nr:NADH dehydrogenase subunit 2 [Fragariocoptes setiger]
MLGLYLWGLFLYGFQMFVFIGMISWYFYWVMIELNLILFLVLVSSITINSFYYLGEVSFSYFMVQVLGSLIFVSSYLLSVGVGDSFSFDDSLFMNLVIFSLFLKMGLFPSHSWNYFFSSKISFNVLLIFITFQKIPIFLLINWVNGLMVFFLFLLSLFFGSFFIVFSFDLIYMLVSSSLMASFYFYFASIMMFNVFLFLNLFYFFTMVVVFSLFYSYYSSFYHKHGSYMMLMVFMIFSGLPPFYMFFLKFGLFHFMSLDMPLMVVFVFSFSSLVSLMGYLSFFYCSFFVPSNYNKNLYFNKFFGLLYFMVPSLVCV